MHDHILSNGSDAHFGPAYSGLSRNFDFTLLFEDTILSIAPATIFLIAAGTRTIWLNRKPNKVSPSFSRLMKLVSCFPGRFTQFSQLTSTGLVISVCHESIDRPVGSIDKLTSRHESLNRCCST